MENPDGIIDNSDFTSSLKRICYEDRVSVYDATLHFIERQGYLDDLIEIISSLSEGFPSIIEKSFVLEIVSKEALHWFVENNILSIKENESYGLIDEFLRVRIILDKAATDIEKYEYENSLINAGIKNY